MTARCLFVLNRADDASGGTLTAALNLAAALKQSGVSVTLSYPVRPGVGVGAAVTQSGILVRSFVARPTAARIGLSLRQMRWLWRSVRSFDAVHVHSCFYAAALYTALVCRLRGVPYVVWPHGSLDTYDVQKHFRIKRVVGPVTVRPMLSAARAVVCTTEREVENLITFGAEPEVRTVPLPVPRPVLPTDPAQARELWRIEHHIPADTVVVLFLGRITRKKRLPTLIAAMARLRDLDVHLVIAGNADTEELRREVDEAIAGYDLASRVTQTGWLDAAACGHALVASDVFALPSENENFGLAVVEAMRAGLAAVISDNVYLAEIFAASDAALVASPTPVAFAAELRRICTSAADREGLADRGRALTDRLYEPARVAARIVALTERPATTPARTPRATG